MIFSKIEIIDGEQYVNINMLENEVRKAKRLGQALNEIEEYVNSDKLLKILCEPKINSKGETHYDIIRNDILKIIDKYKKEDE